MAMWNLLGPRGVDVLAWESFGLGWAGDVVKQLKIAGSRSLEAPYGRLPDPRRGRLEPRRGLHLNGTTSGVRVPDGALIPADRAGLTLCDATLGRVRHAGRLGQAGCG
ncbi:MAG: hypothetical protein R3F55_09155 [Alphaproteobacteria bacterium]